MPPTPLNDALWVAQSRLYHTNNGVFSSDGQACLVDPGIFPDEIAAVADFVGGRAWDVRHLVLTHSHWDHVLGPERFSGVPVVAHARYLDETTAAPGARLKRQVRAWERRHGLKRPAEFTPPRPDAVFEATYVLEVGRLRLELHPAPGHAPDQLVVYEPQTATLWASDILSDLEIPYVSDRLAAYERTLESLAGWMVEWLVPGHGHPARGRAAFERRVAEDRAYLAELRGRVGVALAAGRSADETVALCADMRIRHPQGNAGPHRLNVESAYLELGGPGDPDALGWGPAFETDI